MPTVHLVVGVLVVILNLATGVVGAWHWLRVTPSVLFWRLLRASQAAIVVQLLLGLLLLALGHSPSGDLHILYGVLPVAISFVAEQLRVGSAETILEARGHRSAQEIGALPEAEQRVVVLSIVRREIGVMTLSALVIVVIALRAASEAGGFW
jgi:hypothetical protein